MRLPFGFQITGFHISRPQIREEPQIIAGNVLIQYTYHNGERWRISPNDSKSFLQAERQPGGWCFARLTTTDIWDKNYEFCTTKYYESDGKFLSHYIPTDKGDLHDIETVLDRLTAWNQKTLRRAESATGGVHVNQPGGNSDWYGDTHFSNMRKGLTAKVFTVEEAAMFYGISLRPVSVLNAPEKNPARTHG